MWTRAELKSKGKEAMKRSYWGLVLMGLVISVISGIASSASNGMSGSSQLMTSMMQGGGQVDPDYLMKMMTIMLGGTLAVTIITLLLSIFLYNVLYIGMYRYHLEARYEQKTVSDMSLLGFGFTNGRYVPIMKTMLLVTVYEFLWSLLFVIPGIIKSYEYRMIPYILAENPEIDSQTAFKLSKEMMSGQKWNAFVLDLSFIGWYLLCIPTCGLLAPFYVTPYVSMTNAFLYDTLKQDSSAAGMGSTYDAGSNEEYTPYQ
ncbi:MAG: DUF975 family protein [Lachnospiraceae bacterium]|nr:DUF975 family protein [Lachnospiraceae bacterium]